MFWENNLQELIKEYNRLRKIDDLPGLAKLTPMIVQESPSILEYMLTPLDSMIGMHLVYVITFKNEGFENVFKQGYTKKRCGVTLHKNIQTRFDESRWDRDGKKLIVKDIIQCYEMPSKGAVAFESYIKETLPPSGIVEIKNPGKGEFYDLSDLDKVLKLMDNSVDKYKDMWGFKSPN